jgi:hypothetical protein
MTKEIQMTSARFTKNDMAKYPFLKENTEYIRKLHLKIEDLASAELSAALERAEERPEESILHARAMGLMKKASLLNMAKTSQRSEKSQKSSVTLRSSCVFTLTLFRPRALPRLS